MVLFRKKRQVISSSVQESIDKVFACHLIRHKIFAYAMWYTNDGQFGDEGPKSHYLNKGNALSLRLVCKAWLWSVNYLLRKYREPLANCDLARSDPRSPPHCLLAFSQSFGEVNRIWVDQEHGYCQLTPFALYVFTCFFKEESYSKLGKGFFEKFASGIVKLRLFIMCYNSIDSRWPTDLEPLPFLDRLSIQLCRFNNITPPVIRNVAFLKTIIESGTNLKKLYLRGSLDCYYTEEFVNTVIYAASQRKVTQFHIDCSVNQVANFERHLLGRSGFLGLTSLRLYAISTAFKMDTVFNILNGVRHTLRILQLDGDNDLGLSIPRTDRSYLRFPPKMPKLRTLRIHSNEWYPQIRGIYKLELWHVPKSLRTIQLHGISESMFNRWTKDSNYKRYELVDRLSIYLLQNNWRKKVLPLTKDRMQAIQYAFPNVVHLSVSMAGTEVEGFKYIFREMINLKSLFINILIGYMNEDDLMLATDPENRDIYTGSDYWDALLIGASSSKVMKEVRKMRVVYDEEVDKVMSRLSKEDSIRNLVNLKSLYLKSGDFVVYNTIVRPCLISNMAFYWGFNRMPSLRELELRGNFRSSDAVEKMLRIFHEKRDQSTEYQSRSKRQGPVIPDYSFGFEGYLMLAEMILFSVILWALSADTFLIERTFFTIIAG